MESSLIESPGYLNTPRRRADPALRVYTTAMIIMVLLARHNDDPMLAHERACFVAATGFDRSCFDWRNVVDGVPLLPHFLDLVRGTLLE
jgi:hypothetical protein